MLMKNKMCIVKHIDKNDLEILKESRPEIIFYSETGACGPSGLVLIMLDKKHIYVENAFRYQESIEYERLIKETIRSVPELYLLGLQIKGETYKARKDYEYVYLGLGNSVFIREDIYLIHNLKSFNKFKNYLKKFSDEDFFTISIGESNEKH